MKTVWAIARNTILQARRMKVVAFLGLFAVAVFPLLLYNLKSSGNPKDELQVLLTYALEMATFLLSLLTIFLATWTLCMEVQDKQMFILDSKPVHRYQVLLGKWLGIVIVNAVLLLAMAAPTYGLARWFESRMSPLQQKKLSAELLIGRRPVSPVYPDLGAEVRREYNKRLQQGSIEPGTDLDEVARDIERAVYQRQSSVPQGYSKRWEFRNLPLPEELPKGRNLTVRFTLYSTNPVSKVQMLGTWRFADVRGVRVPARINGLPTVVTTKATIGIRYEFSIPAGVLRSDRRLLVAYRNSDPSGHPAIFQIPGGIELLYPTLSFNQNFFNGYLLILLRISFLAVVGLASATFLTFPMALTVSLTGWLLCLVSHFMLEAASSRLVVNIYAQRSVEGPGLIDEFFRHYIRILFSILPDLHQYNPVPLLVDGREVSYGSVLACFVFLLLLRGGILAGVSALIFHTRELAKLAR